MMTRDEAEAAARKGAKVQHESWADGQWVEHHNGLFYDYLGYAWSAIGNDNKDGWSIVSPTPAPSPGTVLPLSECQPGTAWQDLAIPGIVKVGDRVRVSWVTQEGDTKHLFHVGDVCEVGLADTGSGPKYLAVQTRHGGLIAPRGDRVTFERVEPVEPDLAARVAELDKRMTAIENIVIPTPPFLDPRDDYNAPNPLRSRFFPREPTFRTSRKPDAPGDGVEFKLKAMAINYTERHAWDHLDAKACQDGYDAIVRLRAALSAIREGL